VSWHRQIHRQPWFWLCLAIIAVGVGWSLYPDDRSPRGAYYRVMTAVNQGRSRDLFPYTETEAQHAAFTIGNYYRDAVARVEAAYPEPARSTELERLRPLAQVEPGPGVFAWYAERYGWFDRLRRDLSGIAHIEIDADRATVQTVRGTRYPFRRRDNGIWGLTLFTARLVHDAEKAARDFAQIEAAAKDYQALEQ